MESWLSRSNRLLFRVVSARLSEIACTQLTVFVRVDSLERLPRSGKGLTLPPRPTGIDKNDVRADREGPSINNAISDTCPQLGHQRHEERAAAVTETVCALRE